jgi:hypothetical protein
MQLDSAGVAAHHPGYRLTIAVADQAGGINCIKNDEGFL